jgi:hypothetical protein
MRIVMFYWHLVRFFYFFLHAGNLEVSEFGLGFCQGVQYLVRHAPKVFASRFRRTSQAGTRAYAASPATLKREVRFLLRVSSNSTSGNVSCEDFGKILSRPACQEINNLYIG